MSTLRAALEDTLAANPDDLATHMAYADHLVDLGDPRGEFIQVQLALEDPRRSSHERALLRKREHDLLQAHQREWIGETAEVFLTSTTSITPNFGIDYFGTGGYTFQFVRGWLHALDLDTLTSEFALALARCPTLRLLRHLTIQSTAYEDDPCAALATWPGLSCIRRFQAGPHDNCHFDGSGLVPVLARMPRLEELYLYAHRTATREIFAMPMPYLRKLHVYHVYDYPLDVLGNNPSLGNLVELSCWPHGLEPGDERAYIQPGPFRDLVFSPHLKSLTHLALYLTDLGDAGVRAIVESGILRRLRVLDLWSGRITDEGARLLAACPDLRRLERLRIAQNLLTPAGVAALQATGITLEANGQLSLAAADEGQHLYEGDPE